MFFSRRYFYLTFSDSITILLLFWYYWLILYGSSFLLLFCVMYQIPNKCFLVFFCTFFFVCVFFLRCFFCVIQLFFGCFFQNIKKTFLTSMGEGSVAKVMVFFFNMEHFLHLFLSDFNVNSCRIPIFNRIVSTILVLFQIYEQIL